MLPRARTRLAAAAVSAVAAALLSGLVVPATAAVEPAGEPPATGTTAATVAPTSAGLSWRPPLLTAPETIHVSETNRDLRLDPTKDYVVQMPSQPLTGAGGLKIGGGRNVVLIGGEISLPAGVGSGHAGRGLYLKGQTGTIHVEGLLITGAGLNEGINLDQQLGAVVQLQNVRVDTVHGSSSGDHADVLQTWAGPRQLRVDGLTGSTTYQGLFLLPRQSGAQAQPEMMDLRRVDLTGSPESAYLMWRDDLSWPLHVSDVWVAPRDPSYRGGFLWPKSGAGTTAWPYVQVGRPAAGSFVPEGLAGLGYTSPGYLAEPGVRFSDVPQDHPFFPEVSWLADTRITTGFPNGAYGPTLPVNRAAMAAFLYRFSEVEGYTPPTTSPFSDVPTGHPFYKEIAWLAQSGITAGYSDGTFGPELTISRQAMAAFLFRMAEQPGYAAPSSGRFSDVPVGSAFHREISWLAERGITTGYPDGSFGAARAINRDAMAAFLYRYSRTT